MHTVFEADSSLEAQMILNLLEMEGVNGRLEGEYLQGGVGELQAMGVVGVVVDDEDYALASKIVAEWEAEQPVRSEKSASNPLQPVVGAFIVGVLLGMGLMAVFQG